ncbi:hypothetical protein ACSVIA_18880 [Rhodococcus erythropolis]|uniref:hypothetical protein n=1 Tax=Rhodococcus erythropolis TaxID=1833 RepID=UPI004041198A
MSGSDRSNGSDDSRLEVEPDIARDVVAACEGFLGELDQMRRNLFVIANVSGMGTLQSGINLAEKFSKKAKDGEDSLEKSLNSHIQVVTEMRDFFQQCVDRYGEVDDSNASALTSAETPR